MTFNDLYDYDDGLLINKRTGNIYCNEDRDGYIRIRLAGREYRAHRIIWEMHKGPIPEDMLIDHIDGDKYNNRIENLRLATRQQNNVNSYGKKEGRDLPKGIVKTNNNKYRARLTHLGTTYSLGTFNTVEEAAEAYNTKSVELNGEFAYIANQ